VHHVTALVATLAKGGPVMIPLLVCSVLSLSVIIERAGFWWRRRDVTPAEHALRLVAHAKFDEAAEIAGAGHAPEARVIVAGLGHRGPGAAQAMELVAQEELGLARCYLPVLDTVITLSPLLGLLGTVTGMIAAFGVLSSTGVNQPNATTGGVAEALIATAVGLGIAIATLVPYNYFSARVERAAEAMEQCGSRVEQALVEHEIP
jgi:biopolymer transport protein ExbB